MSIFFCNRSLNPSRLSHQELVGEVIHQVQNFSPENKLIRQRVEGLIEREYVEHGAVFAWLSPLSLILLFVSGTSSEMT